jgi:hypothetical protein
MPNNLISIEIIRPGDQEPTHKAFELWQSALDYIRTLRPLSETWLRVFVPGSRADNGQENELREALGLPPVWN